MGKTKKVIYNTVATSVQMIVAQIISLVVSRRVLEVYGSDLNGVNAILSNMMEWILLLEGGLTLASNVALFKPFVNKDYKSCNRILSATKKQFMKVGTIVLVAGIILAIVYPFFIKTEIPHWDIFLMFTMMSASTSFGVFYTRKYALLLNVSQSEYINTIITTVINIIGNAMVFIVASMRLDYLVVRVVYLLITVITGITISIVVRKRYSFIDYEEEPDFEAIKGTKDVVFQKLTGLVRSSAPLIFISILVSSTFASVYSVYIFIYGFVRKLVMMVINATQSGIGQLIAERKKEEVYNIFRVFEYASTICVCWLMSVAIPMTMPFVRFYTQNVKDVNYVDWLLLFFIASSILVQVLHIPSGIVINMSGAFKEDRNYQIYSCICMGVGILVFSQIWEIYGVLLGILVSSIVLAFFEIRHTRSVFFKKSYSDFFRPLLVCGIGISPVIYIQMQLLPKCFTVVSFVINGIILALVNGIVLVILNIIFEKERFFSLYKRVKNVLVRR